MMPRLIALGIFVLVLVAAIALPEHRPPNANLPVVKAAVPMFPATPTWRLYATCPVDRRNIPILQEKTA